MSVYRRPVWLLPVQLDPPKPWSEGLENVSLADEVPDELYPRDLISQTQRDYYADSCTHAEAPEAHLPDDPVQRAAQIVRLFTSKNGRFAPPIRLSFPVA